MTEAKPPRDSSGLQRAGASLASLAIRSGFVDTLVGFEAPPCCPRTILKRRSPPFLDRVLLSGVPRRQWYYEGSKTSCAEHEVTYLFASPPQLFASCLIPCSGGNRRVWPHLYCPMPEGTIELVERRISQVPRESVPYLCPALRPRPVQLTSPTRSTRCCPRLSESEDTSVFLSRGSITRLRYPLPTLQVVRCRTRMQGSLPVAG